MSAWFRMSATELADAIASGACTASEALESCLARYRETHDALNAVVATDIPAARERARQADLMRARGERLGVLHGVPMTVKDTWNVRGMTATSGVPLYKNHRPRRDASLVERLRRAGANIWGKTNLPLASYDWQSNNPLYGTCHNPWRLDHTPGGSSGGSAAAVASGVSPLELGSDVAGSIRQPAHCCGVYGLRTTEGLLSNEGHGDVPDAAAELRSLIAVGPIARTPEDLDLAMRVLVPPEREGARLLLAAPDSLPLDGARVAWTGTWGGAPLSRETRRALERVIAALEAAGAHVEHTAPPVDMELAQEIWGRINGFELNAVNPWIVRTALGKQLMGRAWFPLLLGGGHMTEALSRGARSDPAGYLTALATRDALIAQADAFYRAWDVWITPVASTPAFPICKTGAPLQVDSNTVRYTDTIAPFNCPTAALANPILSMPAGVTDEGLPIGVQLHARRHHDRKLIDLARRLRPLLPVLPIAEPA